MKIFTVIIGVVFTTVCISILEGYTLATLWGWFMVPTFDVPKIPIVTAIGIVTLMAFTTKNTWTKDIELEEGFSNLFFNAAFHETYRALFYLFYCAHG